MNNLKTIFMGTGEFASESLRKLIELDYGICAIYTKPERSAGRRASAPNPVREIAQTSNIPIFDPVDSLSTDENFAQIAQLAPDIIIVAAYGKILPTAVLELPTHGCVNVHASLLPCWRGASPIHHAIMAGDTVTGVTIMRLDAGLDTGDIIAQTSTPIASDMRTPELYTQLAQIGAQLLVDTLPDYIADKTAPTPQPDEGVTTCRTLKRDDGLINWNQSAQNIYNQFRALTPWPGVFTYWQRKGKDIRIKLPEIELEELEELEIDTKIDITNNADASENADGFAQNSRKPGTVFVDNGVLKVATTNSNIILTQIQREGKSAQSAQNFLNGYPDFANTTLL